MNVLFLPYEFGMQRINDDTFLHLEISPNLA